MIRLVQQVSLLIESTKWVDIRFLSLGPGLSSFLLLVTPQFQLDGSQFVGGVMEVMSVLIRPGLPKLHSLVDFWFPQNFHTGGLMWMQLM